jgi:Asp-tRNA(Asn)/Glu-tRNA(Gln) amidotransferase C subunit
MNEKEIKEIIESLNRILVQIQQIEQLLTQALNPYSQKQKQFYAEPS